MFQTKSPSHQLELRTAIKKLVSDLNQFSEFQNDEISENAESIASYVCRWNDQQLNRSFLDYCMAVKHYERSK